MENGKLKFENGAIVLSHYTVVDFDAIPPVPCPCGQARRAFAEVVDYPATIHGTEISLAARRPHPKRPAETSFFLECEAGARMELDGESIAVRPGMCILIPPLVRHRAVGKMKVLIVAIPKFDANDEWFD